MLQASKRLAPTTKEQTAAVQDGGRFDKKLLLGFKHKNCPFRLVCNSNAFWPVLELLAQSASLDFLPPPLWNIWFKRVRDPTRDNWAAPLPQLSPGFIHKTGSDLIFIARSRHDQYNLAERREHETCNIEPCTFLTYNVSLCMNAADSSVTIYNQNREGSGNSGICFETLRNPFPFLCVATNESSVSGPRSKDAYLKLSSVSLLLCQ